MNLQILQPHLFSTQNCLNVVARSSSLLSVKILDMQGRISKKIIEKVEEGAQQLFLNLNDLKNGIYVLNAFCDNTFIEAIRFTKN